jgi:hypothetical protein
VVFIFSKSFQESEAFMVKDEQLKLETSGQKAIQ